MRERSRVHLRSLGVGVGSIAAPTVEEARAALGGPARGRRTGERVEIERGAGKTTEGLVVLSSEGEWDVWIGDGIFARVRAPAAPRPLRHAAPALDAVARDLTRFAALRVGDEVAARRGHEVLSGVVLEICRYGALVDVGGTVLAVGFRALGPPDPSS